MFAAASALASAQPIKITDYRNLVSLSSVQISPDGKRIAFLRSTQNFETDKNELSVMVSDSTTGELRALTKARPDVSSPRWSPDGRHIAFLSKVSDKAQIFVVSAKGGERHQITWLDRGVQQFSWSPKGDRFAYVSPDANPNAEAIKRHDDTFALHDDGFLTSSIPVPSHLWLIPADGGTPHRLTKGPWSVMETPAPFAGAPSDPSWSPDGKWIAFAQQADPDDSDGDLSRIAAVSVSTGTVLSLTNRSTYEYQPSFSPKGDVIAYLRPHGPTPLSVMDICTTSLHGGDTDATKKLDRDVAAFAWTPDGQGLVAGANDGVGVSLWSQPIGGAAKKLNLNGLVPTEFSLGRNGAVAFLASTARTPPELYYLPSQSAKLRCLTDFNAALRKRSYSRATEVSWQAPDGEHCDGVLTYPKGYVAGRRCPLIVMIHGGPEQAALAQFVGFEGDYLRQPFAGDGYFFFQPNYRGSDNLGNHHEHAIYRDPGEGPASDVMSGIAMLDRAGMIDENRVSVVGHSYGGYMTTWLISHSHGWRSAVVADGCVDWTEEYNLSADGNLAFTRDSLGGSPTDPKSAALYRTGSPITYAFRIRTPTLILSGTADETVPITESFQLYHVLKDHHVPVRFIAIPGAHHTPDDPVKHERFYELMKEWVENHDR